MKILYTADDRHDAQLAATAVRGLADDVKVVWAARLADAGQWLSQNPDLAALIVDAEVQGQSCAALVRHVRTLGLTTQVLVVVSETAPVPAAVLGAGADGFVVRNQSLFTNLASLIGRAMHREQTEQRLQAALAARVRLHEALEKQLTDSASLRQKLDARLADALTLVQRRDADVDATLARLRTRESELAEAADTRRALEARLAGIEEALRTETATRDSLDRELAAAREELARAVATLQEVQARHVSVLANTAEAERRGVQRQAELESAISQEIATRRAVERELEMIQRELTESEEALRDADTRHASEIEVRTAAHAALEQNISNLVQQHASLAEAASVQLAERQRDYEARVALLEAELIDVRAAQQLAAAQHSEAEQRAAQRIASAEERHASFAEAAGIQLADQRRDYESRVAQLETELGEVRASAQLAAAEHSEAERLAAQQIADAEARHASFAEAVDNQLADQRRDYESRVARLEAELGDVRATGQLAAAQHSEAERRAAQQLADAEGRHASESSAAASAHAALAQQLSNLEQQHASFVETANARFAAQQHDYETRSAQFDAEAIELRAAVERAVAERAEAEQHAATRAAESQERHSSELTTAAAARAALEETIAALRSQHASSMDEAAAQFTNQQAQYEARLAEQASAREGLERTLRDAQAEIVRMQRESESSAAAAAERLARRESELAAASAARLALEQRLVEIETALGQAKERAVVERTAALKSAAMQHSEFDAQLAREVEARGAVERELVETRAAGQEQLQGLSNALDQARVDAAQAVERLTSDHALQVVSLQALVAERDAQLHDQSVRHAEAQHNAQHSLAALESDLRAAIAARSQQIDQLNGELQALTRELATSRNHRDALQLEAHRAPELARQLAATRSENRRLFERSPVSILRCSHDGVLQEANHALVNALGFRTVDELRALEFPSSIFESEDDLRWLLQRCQNGPRQSGDCILKKKDGGRLSMRLHASAVSAETIEIVAEDLTSLRAVEERLSKAHRMEAVGRLASEIADTCGDLLRNAGRSGEELLASLGDTPLRAHGEIIFGDLTRATNFLRQLSAYSHKQAQDASPVDVNRVLRDMEPVLKRVAGDDIELVLPRKASALHVDVDAERVERVLVNIAAYGRTRMPTGGRLIVELARVAVDRKFTTKYPNVREGGHALIRVSEVRTGRMTWPIAARGAGAGAPGAEKPDSPGVDLGALQTLIGECGGHIWVNAEPGGNMEVKIRLPLRPGERTAPTARTSGNAVTRWFQS